MNRYKPLESWQRPNAGDVVKIKDKATGAPRMIRVDTQPRNNGAFRGHDHTGRIYYHLNDIEDALKAYTRTR